MSGRRWRAAVIGTGRIASSLEKDPLRTKPHSHAGWYRHHPRTDLVAGCDVDPAALAAFGADWDVPTEHLYRDYREMLERERPDIVSVCAYAPQRVEMCEAAIEAGAAGLWLEKAVACSCEEAERLSQAVARAGVVAIVDQPRRADPRYRATRRLAQSGAWGRLESIHALFSGHIVHTGTHAWDVLDFWCGPWASLLGWLDSGPPGQGTAADGRRADDAATPAWSGELPGSGERDRGGNALVTFASGTHAFVSGRARRYFSFEFDLVFEDGRLRVGNGIWQAWRPANSTRYTGFVELAPADADALVAPVDHYPHPMVYDLVHAMETGRQPLMSLAHAVTALELGVAVFQSHRDGNVAVGPAGLDRTLRVLSR